MNTQYQNLTNFAERIEEIEKTKNDFIVPSNLLRMNEDNESLQWADKHYQVNEYAHGQIASKLSIPKGYYDRIKDIPGLRAHNVNELLKAKPARYTLRTLDEKCRAVLSDKYSVMDNYDVLSTSLLPAVMPFKNDITVKSLNISDTKMYIQLIFNTISGEVKPGDVVHYGLTITNSEVGAGALDVKSFIYRLVCSNGAISASLFRKYHVGKRVQEEEQMSIYRPDTIKKELEGYQLRIRDVIAHSLNGEEFEKSIKQLRDAREDKIEDLTSVIENTTKRFMLSESDGKFMVNNICAEGEMNRYGLANSITALAKQFENPDKQYQLEKTGAQIIELSAKDWKFIN